MPGEVLDLVREWASEGAPAMMLERDGNYPPARELFDELDAIADAAGFDRVTGEHRAKSAVTGLADRQAALVRALVAAGEGPGGFDRDALDTVSTALLRKRSGEVGDHVPHVREACGDRFFALFAPGPRGGRR